MAAAATTPFDSLPDEIVLKIIKMAALDWPGYSKPHLNLKFHFIMDVLFKISVRFRQIATDPSLWKGQVTVYTKPAFRELDFVIRECLNNGTTSMKVFVFCAPPPRRIILTYPNNKTKTLLVNNNLPYATVALPTRHLIDLATKFPNLKMVVYWGSGDNLVFEEDIPVPWSLKDNKSKFCHKKMLTRD